MRLEILGFVKALAQVGGNAWFPTFKRGWQKFGALTPEGITEE
jgi:hypothetical protein